MAMRFFRTGLLTFLLVACLCPLASCQTPANPIDEGDEFCEDETDCADGEVCVFDSGFNGTVCRDGALFGL